jgi:serine O-acetyltransferase
VLWQAIEKLSQRARELPAGDCVPRDAQTTERSMPHASTSW